MNKSELLASMAEKGKITKVDAERALNAFIQTVEETLVFAAEIFTAILCIILMRKTFCKK